MNLSLNQALDLLYNYHNIDDFPEVKALRHKLSILKIKHWGNTKIENAEQVAEIIKSVEKNPKNKR